MYIVGFVDNSFKTFPQYHMRLARQGIDLLPAEAGMTKEEIASWVLNKHISCLMVDYLLIPDFSFTGTDLVVYLNNSLPELPCMIVTAHPQESVAENLVLQNLITDRDALSATDIKPFVDILKQACDVFINRLHMYQKEFIELYDGRIKNKITAQEEERYLYLYKLLRAYDEVDDLPIELIKPEMESKMDSLIEKLDKAITNLKSNQKEV